MFHSITFVCRANVCRSPLMAFTFAQAIRADSPASTWTVGSGGTQVDRALPFCDFGARLISDDPAGREFTSSHVSTQITNEDLDGEDLIIAASREERGVLARMDPSLRARTFTLKEAILLGAADVTLGSSATPSAVSSTESPLRTYARLLNSRRGRVSAASRPAVVRFRAWASSADPQEIPDVHHENARKHLATLKELRDSIHVLHAQVGGFLAENQ